MLFRFFFFFGQRMEILSKNLDIIFLTKSFDVFFFLIWTVVLRCISSSIFILSVKFNFCASFQKCQISCWNISPKNLYFSLPLVTFLKIVFSLITVAKNLISYTNNLTFSKMILECISHICFYLLLLFFFRKVCISHIFAIL